MRVQLVISDDSGEDIFSTVSELNTFTVKYLCGILQTSIVEVFEVTSTEELSPGKIIHVFDITKGGRIAVCGYTGFYDKIIPPTSKQIDTVNCKYCLKQNYLVKSD